MSCGNGGKTRWFYTGNQVGDENFVGDFNFVAGGSGVIIVDEYYT